MRPEKASVVLDLTEKLKRSPFVLVTDYQRMKVGDFSELRNRLAPAGAEVHVVKNNFLKRAMTDSGFPEAGETLTGQTAVVTGDKDVAPVAKIFKTFAAEFKARRAEDWLCRSGDSFRCRIGNAGRPAGARSFAGAIAGTALVSRNALRAITERTGLRICAAIEREGRKGGRGRASDGVK